MAEPLNATFFTLQHRDRAVLLPTTCVLAVIVALLVAAFAALNWNTLAHFGDWFLLAPETKDPARIMAFVSGFFALFGTTFLFMIPLYFAIAAYEAACLRWMIRGEAPGLFGFAFDHDMWRVYGVYWCWVGLHLAVGMAMGVVMIPVMFATMGEMMSHPGDVQAMMRWQFTVQLPLSLLQYVPLVFLGVRFGPAAATSIARRRFSFLEAWTVTRGRFWKLLGSFALLWLMAGVALTVIFALTAGPALAQLWALFHGMAQKPSPGEVQAFITTLFSPQNLALISVGYAANIVVMLGLALMSYGVNARAALVALDEGKIAVVPAES